VPPDCLQRKALALVGAAGRRGALQTDVAAALGAENRNFFYVVKVGAGRLRCRHAGWLRGAPPAYDQPAVACAGLRKPGTGQLRA
jgi:hypothetical protein